MISPPPEPATSSRRLWWALPLVTLSWLVIFSVIISGAIPIQRWETAPGTASAVGPRMEFTGQKRYESQRPFMFVTAFGTQLTALESVIGWVDPDVDVQTKRQRFGDENPSTQRRLGFQAMIGAKQIAEYVALNRLGYEVAFKYGSLLVEQVICEKDPAPLSACKVLNPGDVVESFNGKPTPTIEELVGLMAGLKASDTVTLVIHELNSNADKTRRTVKVQLIASPNTNTGETEQRVIIGFIPADTRTVTVPFEVDIDTESIGGSSAGLAFTLSLLDELTPGELSGRARVAVTGTISEDGTVGAIGALRQKTVAVKAAGVKVFLVPKGQSAAEIAEARSVAGNSLRIIPVGSVDEALNALKKFGGGMLPKR